MKTEIPAPLREELTAQRSSIADALKASKAFHAQRATIAARLDSTGSLMEQLKIEVIGGESAAAVKLAGVRIERELLETELAKEQDPEAGLRPLFSPAQLLLGRAVRELFIDPAIEALATATAHSYTDIADARRAASGSQHITRQRGWPATLPTAFGTTPAATAAKQYLAHLDRVLAGEAPWAKPQVAATSK